MAFSPRSHINIPIVARLIGWLLMIEAAFMLFPLATSIIYQEKDLFAFIISTAVTATCGFIMAFCIHPSHFNMAKREAFLLTSLVWVVFSLFGMLPFILAPCSLSVSDAFFEAMSGFSTTGATIIPDVESLPHGINLWRCLMQWIGGMGIILFTLAVIPMLNHSGGMQMFNAEVTGITHDKIRPRVSQTAKRLWLVYIILTIILWLLLWGGPMDLFDSICHTLTTISAGGFSSRNASVETWSSTYIDIILIVFMFLAGVSFTLLYRAITGNIRSLWTNDAFRTYVRIIGLMYIVFVVAYIANGNYNTISELLLTPLFQIVSAATSTAYIVGNLENSGPFILSLSITLMFFGACAGSTSGGAKIDRLLFLLKNIRNELYRIIHPNAIVPVRINKNVIPAETTSKVITFLCVYVLVILIGGFILTAMQVPICDAFISSFACVSNSGISASITGYSVSSYYALPDAGKWVLSLLMMIGRLELFTVLVLFTSGYWKK